MQKQDIINEGRAFARSVARNTRRIKQDFGEAYSIVYFRECQKAWDELSAVWTTYAAEGIPVEAESEDFQAGYAKGHKDGKAARPG